MDIAAMSMALSQMQLQQQAGTSVLKMAMETPEAQMNKLVQSMDVNAEISAKTMEHSVTPHLGTNVDLSI